MDPKSENDCEIYWQETVSGSQSSTPLWLREEQLKLRTEVYMLQLDLQSSIKENSQLRSEYHSLQSVYFEVQKAHTSIQEEYSRFRDRHSQLQQEHTQLQGEHTQLQGEIKGLVGVIRRIEATLSWRLTRPLRLLLFKMKKGKR